MEALSERHGENAGSTRGKKGRKVGMITEDQYDIWMDDLMKEEMDEIELNWELYCREVLLDHPSVHEAGFNGKKRR